MTLQVTFSMKCDGINAQIQRDLKLIRLLRNHHLANDGWYFVYDRTAVIVDGSQPGNATQDVAVESRILRWFARFDAGRASVRSDRLRDTGYAERATRQRVTSDMPGTMFDVSVIPEQVGDIKWFAVDVRNSATLAVTSITWRLA